MSNDATGIKGIVNVVVYDENGNVKYEETHHNLITTTGDTYYAKQGAAGVGGNTAPTLVARMKLGTGTAAETKSAIPGAAMQTYVSGSNVAFDTVATSSVGTDVGYKIRYTSTWGAGVATNTALTEAIITTDTTNAAGSASDTISRVVFTAVNKGANDTLVINWDHVFYDAP